MRKIMWEESRRLNIILLMKKNNEMRRKESKRKQGEAKNEAWERQTEEEPRRYETEYVDMTIMNLCISVTME